MTQLIGIAFMAFCFAIGLLIFWLTLTSYQNAGRFFGRYPIFWILCVAAGFTGVLWIIGGITMIVWGQIMVPNGYGPIKSAWYGIPLGLVAIAFAKVVYRCANAIGTWRRPAHIAPSSPKDDKLFDSYLVAEYRDRGTVRYEILRISELALECSDSTSHGRQFVERLQNSYPQPVILGVMKLTLSEMHGLKDGIMRVEFQTDFNPDKEQAGHTCRPAAHNQAKEWSNGSNRRPSSDR